MTIRALVAATAGAAAFASGSVLDCAGLFSVVCLAVLGAALPAAALFDLTQRRIPNRIVLPAAATRAALTFAAGAPLSLGAGLATILLLLIVSLRWPAALGMGDVKLALLLVLGLDGDARLRSVSFLQRLGVALMTRQGRTAWRTSLSLAPFLAVGALVTVMV